MVVLLVFLLAAFRPASSQGCSYGFDFEVAPAPYESTQCSTWLDFQTCLGESFGQGYEEIRITSSLGAEHVCSELSVASAICNFLSLDALAVPASTGFDCNGQLWWAGDCGATTLASMEVSVGFTQACSCSSLAAVRPCIANSNFGGVNTTTCAPPAQRMDVECVASEARDCENCNAAQSEGGCDVPLIEACVCELSPTCCTGEWNAKCAALVEDVCPFECANTAPSCDAEPVVDNTDVAVSGCNGTASGHSCATLTEPQCNANFSVLWNTAPLCYAGDWIIVPQCASVATATGHLWFISFDNLLFSYHRTAVIRLWQSEPNDMELQIRTLRPAGIVCDATLIGQMAFRAGSNLITVVGSEDFFDVRINGVQPVPAPGVETSTGTFSLGSGPDELLVELKESSMSIVSKRGALLNIFFYHTAGMSWLVVPHSLDPSAFAGNTRGLLGEYDFDPLNDFTMRNGTVLPVLSLDGSNDEQQEFGNSWVMSATESLFGADEDAIAAADSQYFAALPGTQGIACPTDFSNYSVPECDALDAQLVDACYFDVVLGGPQFLDDIQYLPACGSNSDQFCSFHGECVNDACECDSGWSGADCEIRVCPTECVESVGSTGGCREDGLCDCLAGFTGQYCEDAATCADVDDCNADSGQGVCVDTNVCECTSIAYDLPSCSSPPVPPFTAAPAPVPVPAPVPTSVPTDVPTSEQTPLPTAEPTPLPTAVPTSQPTAEPTPLPTAEPTSLPTAEPTPVPTAVPTSQPTAEATPIPTSVPTPVPTPVPSGNIAIEICPDDQYEGVCVPEDDEVATASVICCREYEYRRHWWCSSWRTELECVTEHEDDGDHWYWHRHRRDNSNDAECFPTDVTFDEAAEFCEDLDTDDSDDWRLCTLEELTEDSACCNEDNGNQLLGQDDDECEPTGSSAVWVSDLCVPLPVYAPIPDGCDCDVEIAQVREEILVEILGGQDIQDLIAAEVSAQLGA